MRGLTGERKLLQKKTLEGWVKQSQSPDGCEGILEEYLQFVRDHGQAPSQRAVDEAERSLYRTYKGRGAGSPANRKLSNVYALKLRCDINRELLGLRCTHLTADKFENILRRYFAFINANRGRVPCQHSSGTACSLYFQYQRAKRKLPNEQCRELERKIEQALLVTPGRPPRHQKRWSERIGQRENCVQAFLSTIFGFRRRPWTST